MARKSSVTTARRSAVGTPRWSAVLRALREARGVTQEGWAARLGIGRTTLQRWETGKTVPDIGAEEAIIRVCREHALFRAFAHGPLQGQQLTEEMLQSLLAEARLGIESPVPERPQGTLVAQLLESRGEDFVMRHALLAPATTLGRSLDNDIVVEHPLISRHHATLQLEGSSYVLLDLGSTNGTFLNTAQITQPETLRDGDQIQLGGLVAPRLVLYLPNEATTTLGSPEEPSA